MTITKEDIERQFTYNVPSQLQIEKMQKVRDKAKELSLAMYEESTSNLGDNEISSQSWGELEEAINMIHRAGMIFNYMIIKNKIKTRE